MSESNTIFTVGYSNVSFDIFLDKIKTHISLVVDVRSVPYSKYTPQFNRENIKKSLKKNDIFYIYVGDMVGGWPRIDEYYTDGIADYTKMVHDKKFSEGLEIIINKCKKYNVALTCSEQNPFTCHRFLLIGRELKKRGFDVCHIIKNGTIKKHHEVEKDMICSLTKKENKFVTESDDKINAVYWCKNRRHGHKKKK